MSSAEPVAVALAGCGRVAERGYIPAFERARGVRLVAVADPEPGRCEAVAPGVPPYSSLEALLGDRAVDAVVVASATATHVELARVAAGRGLPALVEKPAGGTVSAAGELARLQPRPWIGFNRRFDPELVRVREALAGGRRALELELELEMSYVASRWRPHVSHDEAIVGLGLHLIDLARWFTSAAVDSVRASELTPTRVELELALGGSRARLRCANDRPWRERVAASDEAGRRVARVARGGLMRNALAVALRRGADALVVSLAGELEALAQELRGGGGTQLASPQDGLEALAVVDAARRSWAEGGAAAAVQPAAAS